ncbi:MAG: FAD-binding oxidoreductase [Gomphosphaeria aponina SAG 52.96 = DSM 107014]|uniref:FAD-binding oxidoreductase n=1 Tax=Gomphosphaeria aponina SAG 52.96 = DSM 107014 TaxID=1521640 RepID=A0A941JLM3_9CHRO|nr:FAD-binding oxidoreductase [Gomphosphaeria aponina SAG 52.96 = DSM 107014]
MNLITQILSQMPQDVLSGLRRADQLWQDLRLGKTQGESVVKECKEILTDLEWDVVISGGTLGILIGAALQRRGIKVALLERGILRGREQEWNISRQELKVFLDLDLLTEEELAQAIATEYNPARVSFYQGQEIWVKDVLNIGVDPVFLLATLKKKFLEAGGKLLEKTPFNTTYLHPNGVCVQAGKNKLNARLFIDAMGNFSPLTQQARKGGKPEGVCLVVGSCAQGYQFNDTGDLIVSFTPIQNQCQYFWEAFPARDGRTTYLFTYLDAHQSRPSLEFLLAEYLRLLPEYQKVELAQLKFERFLFGFFPSYRQSPLRLSLDRVLQVGDSCGGQSPVSFGGFGAMVRHLQRLTLGIDEALKVDLLSHEALSLLQPYQPNISVTWLFQRTMSVRVEQQISPNQINDLMSGVFAVMEQLGDDVLQPFLQDVIQFPALSKTLPLVKPGLVLPIIPQVGVPLLADWLIHYFNLGLYSGLYPLGKLLSPLVEKLSPAQQYYYHRWLDAWKYGSGGDYHGS